MAELFGEGSVINGAYHWCLKSVKSGFAIAIVACLKNIDVWSLRIDAQK